MLNQLVVVALIFGSALGLWCFYSAVWFFLFLG